MAPFKPKFSWCMLYCLVLAMAQDLSDIPVKECSGPMYSVHGDAYVGMGAVGCFLVVLFVISICLVPCAKKKEDNSTTLLICLFVFSIVCLGLGIALVVVAGINLYWMRRYTDDGCDDLYEVQLPEPLPIEVVTMPANLKIAFVGDSSTSYDALQVYQLIKSEGAEALVHLGDYDYCDDPTLFNLQLDATLGESFPIIPVVGNHDIHLWSDYQEFWKSRFEKMDSTHLACSGLLGVNYFCIYRGVFFAFSSVGTMCGDGYKEYDYHEEQLQQHLFTSDSFDFNPWRICAWHKNQNAYQLGAKSDETGYGVYEICKDYSALIVTGHDHNYARSHTLQDMENQIVAEECESSCIYNLTDVAMVAVSGLGGKNIVSAEDENDKREHWGSTFSGNYGALFCDFNYMGNQDLTSCYFKDIDGDQQDSFMLYRGSADNYLDILAQLAQL